MKELILLEHFINSQRISNAERLEATQWLLKVQNERNDTIAKLKELQERLETLKKLDADKAS